MTLVPPLLAVYEFPISLEVVMDPILVAEPIPTSES